MIDGCSRLCCALTALTTKLPYTAYKLLFEPFIYSYGMPDQLITDHGTEWAVISFVCQATQ